MFYRSLQSVVAIDREMMLHTLERQRPPISSWEKHDAVWGKPCNRAVAWYGNANYLDVRVLRFLRSSTMP